MLGLSAWKGGDLTKAEEAFEKALSIDPNHVKSLVNLSRVLIDQNRIDDALVRLTHAGDIDPNSTDVQRLLGRAYHAQGKTDEAADAYRRAIELDDKDAWSMNNLAFILIEEGRYSEALPALARATELRKDVVVFFNNLGMALEQVGQFRAAEDAYTLACTLEGVSEKSVANRDRVAVVKEQPGITPVDLAALASAFASELAGSGSVATTTVTDTTQVQQ